MLTDGKDTTVADATHTDWHKHVLCSRTDPGLWFPEPGEDETPAKVICGRCPVRAACLAYALDTNEQYGIWGGLSPKERREIRRRERASRHIGIAPNAEGEAA